MGPEDGVSARYLGDEGARYHAVYASVFELRAAVFAEALAPHVAETDFLVEVGCADGDLLRRVRARRVLGVEPNPRSQQIAIGRGLQVVSSLAEVGTGEADIVVSNHVLEHVLNPHGLLQDIRRTLRPGGKLVINVPIDDWRRQRSPKVPDADFHLYTWTPQGLANLLAEAGFDRVETRIVNRAFPGRLSLHLHRRLSRRAFAWVLRLAPLVTGRRDAEGVAFVP